MSSPRPAGSGARAGQVPAHRPLLARRNLLILLVALLVLVAGYLTLQAGYPSAAAVILVLGYCVLFPIGIAL
jgi:hypothetical protein